MRVLIVAVLAVVLSSGCLGENGPARDPITTPTADAFARDAVEAIAGCTGGCWEPAIAIDPEGRIFVVAAHEPRMGISTDGGRTYAQQRTPPLPTGAPAQATQWDGTVAVGPSGNLYYYAFLAVPSPAGVPVPIGLQVASSTDAAKTWTTNAYLSLTTLNPGQPVVSPWKSWLGFGPDGTVYLDYNSRGTGLWFARSDDGGRTFGQFRRVAPPEERFVSVFMGPPVVDSLGRLYIPYFAEQTPQDPGGNPFLPKGHVLRVATSDDKGATFRYATVATKGPPDYVGAFFPVLAVDGADRLFLAHWDPQSRMQVRASLDRGLTWKPPVLWSGDQTTIVAPWIDARGGRLSMVFYADGLRYARGNATQDGVGAPDEEGALSGSGVGGDFAHFAFDADGHIVAPWPEGGAVRVGFGPS